MDEPTNPIRLLIAIGALILICGALALARSVFAPVAFAIFIIAIVWPVQRGLQAVLPKVLACAISVVGTAAIILAFGSLITWGFGRVVRSVISDATRLQGLYAQTADWLETHGIVLAGLWAEHFNIPWLLRLLPELTSRFNSTSTFLFVILIYVILGLLEVEDVARKLSAGGARGFGQVLLAGSARTAGKLRRFMLVRTLMSLMTGALVWAFVAMMGLDLALEWGVIAFVLNYIPVIGPLIATVFPTLYAMAQFASWQTALLVFVCLNLIQFLVGSYLEPRVAGNALAMSPFIVLFAVFFWTFLWGLSGAFIGVPIVIAILTICDQHPSSRWIADLLGAPRDRTDEARTPLRQPRN
ncbi:AI-2E family transporter [Methylobacterium soli]|uniref:AI-2E family transporter n=1 Tax=Methylobacterium soli TaxID=553447 RepID=A0A6L3T4L8_9HYPH|nr:AI-2E family transporter [Methylobacterium soli]KAB1081886.1 AI-2E family transporter [Methylobacterium soli]GJE42697.1 AI-2 transport protein TqsA [Methylobacterium soli]